MKILATIQEYKQINKNGQSIGNLLKKIKSNRDDLLEELKALTPELTEEVPVGQRFSHLWHSVKMIPMCDYCGRPKKFRAFTLKDDGYLKTCGGFDCLKKCNVDNTKKGMLKKYGVENISQTKMWHDKVKSTNNERYGCDYQIQSKNFQEKFRDTSLKKYGVDHPTKSKEVQDKKIKTVIKKYGVDHVQQNKAVLKKTQKTNLARYGGISSMCGQETKEKARKTNMEKHGTDWYTQSQDFKTKAANKMKEKYGVIHASQNVELFAKAFLSGTRSKLFEFESGRLEKVQGYEPFALADLLKSGIKEDDIIVCNKEIEKNTGRIWYEDTTNKRRKYYPDIYVISLNKIIEVKSEYTFEKNKTLNLLKKQAAESIGINFEFWIYDDKGVLLRKI